ncbi:hypothetical protein [Saccharospirillum alexandrii]|uniref:hypothetical protein n=1 Tax=Saccharospirillum alexandrii TaxID=2448477 RepID=UPI00373580D3
MNKLLELNMDEFIILLVLIVLGVIILWTVYGYVVVAKAILTSHSYEWWQKFVIMIFTLLLPIIGAAFVFRVLSDEFETVKRKRIPLIPFLLLASDLSGSGFESSNNHSESSGMDGGGGNGD